MKNAIMAGAMVALALLTAGFSACSGVQTQHQRIAATCDTAASALEALTAAKTSGRITSAQLQQAIDVYKPTVPFCQPEPATSLSASDYAVLAKAAVTLAAKQGALK